MNKLIVLTTLILLFNFVEFGSSDLICKVFEADSERLPMFVDCATENFPESFIDIIKKCHETSFGSPGTVTGFLEESCAKEEDKDGLTALNQCMYNHREEFERIGKEVMRNSHEATEACFLEKAGLTRSEYLELLTVHSSEIEENDE